jgi:hypothetical protein
MPDNDGKMQSPDTPEPHPEPGEPARSEDLKPADQKSPPREIGGRKGLEPTRFGDWEKNGRCIDF